ncbi:hypothetical protein ACHQM5_021444 [Ranunculus cassubicifolius]
MALTRSSPSSICLASNVQTVRFATCATNPKVCSINHNNTGKARREPTGITRYRPIFAAMQENKKIIVCDEKLKQIFAGKDRVGFLEISGLLNPHFIKRLWF